MRRKLTQRVGAGVAALSIGALSACGSGGSTDMELSDDPVTIRVTWWGSDARAKLTNDAIAAFEKEYPNVTVKGEYKDWNGYWDGLATTTAANDAPDVIQMDELYLASYGDRGALLDLNDASDLLDTSHFEKTSLETGQIDGAQYGMPIGVAVLSGMVNADLFKKYDVKLPDDATWTWDEYADVANELTKKSDGAINGSGVTGGMDIGSVKYWARQQGNALFGKDGKVTLKPEVLASMWQYNLDLMKSGGVESAAQTVESWSAGIDAGSLATGKIAMGFHYNTQITALRESSGDDLRLVQLPRSGKAEANFFKPSMYWSASSKSDHPAEAAAFIDFMVNYEDAADILKTERGIPANEKIRKHVSSDLSESDELAVDHMDSVTPGDSPLVTPNGGSGIEPMLQRYTQEVYSKKTSPKAAAKAFIDELQGEVDSAQ